MMKPPGPSSDLFFLGDDSEVWGRRQISEGHRALTGVLAVLTGDDLKVAGYKPLPSNAPAAPDGFR